MSATSWIFPNSTWVETDDAVDGDTFSAEGSRSFDAGFHITSTAGWRQKFRLNRCNAAPRGTPSGDGATARLAELLSTGPFTLESVGPYKYGDEWMAEITLQDGRNVTDVMVAEQWTAEWTGRGSRPNPPWPRTVA